MAALTELTVSSIEGVPAKATAAMAALTVYDGFSQSAHSRVEAGHIKGGTKVATVDNLDASGAMMTAIDALSAVIDQHVLDTQAAATLLSAAGPSGSGFSWPSGSSSRWSSSSRWCARSPHRSTRSRTPSRRSAKATSRHALRCSATMSSAGWHGSSTINQINDIQQAIATAVEEQTAAINEIARSMSDAASGSGSISITIDGVTDAAQSTSSGASRTQTATNELAQMASSLEQLVGAFRY